MAVVLVVVIYGAPNWPGAPAEIAVVNAGGTACGLVGLDT